MGSKSGDATIGFKYYLGVVLLLCQGPVDAITEFIYGERSAWTGNQTSDGDIAINKPELMGGDTAQGGVVGTMTVRMGGVDTQDPYLIQQCGNHTPSYQGLAHLIFKKFLWSSMNPYFKVPWVRFTRILKGWDRDGSVWYPEVAVITATDGVKDMNPIHMLYQLYTDTRFGMGYSSVDLDDANWRAAALVCYNEGFGLSDLWIVDSTSIGDYVQKICSTINAGIGLDLRTGQFVIKMIRDDYVVANLLNFNPDNVIALNSFQRTGWGDTASAVVVKYTDRDQNTQSVTAQDLALIDIQSSQVNVTREYPAIRTQELANRVAMRDLNTVSASLSSVSLTVNRVAYDLMPGDVFTFTWPDEGLNNIVYRIAEISKGELADGQIQIDAVEDVFGLPLSTYAGSQGGMWTDPVVVPPPITVARVFEAPYWDIVRNMTAANFAYLTPGYAFGEQVAMKPVSSAQSFKTYARTGLTFNLVGSGQFTPTGLLAQDIAWDEEAIQLAGWQDLSMVDVGDYGMIEDECFEVTTVSVALGIVGIKRGVLDTIPRAHPATARVWFTESLRGYDQTEYSLGDHVDYKLVAHNGKGSSDLATAPILGLDMVGRAQKPYPPGQFKVNNVYFPDITWEKPTLTWAHRNRLQQTAELVDYSVGNIGPEPGTTYTIKVVKPDGTVVRTVTGLTGTTYIYDALSQRADGYLAAFRFIAFSVVAGNNSWQQHDVPILRRGYGFNYGSYGGY